MQIRVIPAGRLRSGFVFLVFASLWREKERGDGVSFEGGVVGRRCAIGC